MQLFKATASYFNGRYWVPDKGTERFHATNWAIGIARAARRFKALRVIIRMKPGDKLTITIECLRSVKPIEADYKTEE